MLTPLSYALAGKLASCPRMPRAASRSPPPWAALPPRAGWVDPRRCRARAPCPFPSHWPLGNPCPSRRQAAPRAAGAH